MLLVEFLDQDSATATKIVVLTNQLEQDIKDGKVDDDFTTDDLLDYFQQYDVILDVEDLYNMIKVKPLKDIIKNIKGDRVIFKGQDDTTPEYDAPESDDKKTVKKMAKKAMKI